MHVKPIVNYLAGGVLAVCILPVWAADIEDLNENPCLATPIDTVAELFDISPDKLKQNKHEIASRKYCKTKYKTSDYKLPVNFQIRLMENEERAEKEFKSQTKSVTKEEMAAAVAKLQEIRNKKAGETSNRTSQTQNAILGALANTSSTFEDVTGIGDAARYKAQDGQLYVLKDEALFKIEVYSGPRAINRDVPADVWQASLLKNRKEPTLKLAESIFDSLD